MLGKVLYKTLNAILLFTFIMSPLNINIVVLVKVLSQCI